MLWVLLCSANGSAWGDSHSAPDASAVLYPAQAPGPFDVVILDLMHQSLLQALQLLAHPVEAQVGGDSAHHSLREAWWQACDGKAAAVGGAALLVGRQC